MYFAGLHDGKNGQVLCLPGLFVVAISNSLKTWTNSFASSREAALLLWLGCLGNNLTIHFSVVTNFFDDGHAMKADFEVEPLRMSKLIEQFSNLVGTVYKQGNLVFVQDGSAVLSPVGSRISFFDLLQYLLFDSIAHSATNHLHLHSSIARTFHG